MSINILDANIINRISAGEVVESPFSVVKELLDNSIDANATKISIEIINGGIDKIIIKDNGCGIEQSDLKKAFLPHATSKISNIDDLDGISTLGFRGEALASISNVSQVSLISKTAKADCAYSLQVNGGMFGEITPCSREVGTTIEVNNLFYNTPARRKFLRKPKLEEAQITNIINRYIMAHSTISFKYTVDNKLICQTNGSGLKNAICGVYGNEILQNVLEINFNRQDFKMSGYVSKVGFSKPNTVYQTLILNNRYVIDETVSKAVYKAYEEYLMPRQFPFYVLNIEMNKFDVDVNVHPSKLNVKFSNTSKIFELVYSAVSSVVYECLHPKENIKPIEKTKIEDVLIKTDIKSLQEIEIKTDTTNQFKSFNTVSLKQDVYSPITFFDLQMDTKKEQTEVNKDEIEEIRPDDIINLKKNEEYVDIKTLPNFKIIGELFNEFIVLEKDDNFILIDFHAGHERLNYDKFNSQLEQKQLVVQNLLIPYTHDLTEQEVEFVLSLKDKLNELGFEVDRFGDKTIVINTIPVSLKDINLKSFVEDLVHDMKNLQPKMNNEIKHYLMQKACKSSVKSGMKLTNEEIKELLSNLDSKNPVLLCPHGRPVLIVINRAQIEKWFKRIV